MPDALRRRVVAEALTWRGVPYAHQHRERRAVDCVGLVICVGVAARVMDRVEGDERWARFRGYGRTPVPAEMRAGLEAFLVGIAKDSAAAGDVVWFRDHGQPRHLGILLPDGKVIHACQARGRVVICPLTRHAAGFVSAAFRYPGLHLAMKAEE